MVVKQRGITGGVVVVKGVSLVRIIVFQPRDIVFRRRACVLQYDLERTTSLLGWNQMSREICTPATLPVDKACKTPSAGNILRCHADRIAGCWLVVLIDAAIHRQRKRRLGSAWHQEFVAQEPGARLRS